MNKIEKGGVVMKIAMLVFILSGCLVSALFSQTTHEVNLAGYNNVPPVQTAAMGTIEVTADGDSLFISGSFENLRGRYWAAYIHYGEEGKNGNRIIQLRADLNNEGNRGEISIEKNRFELRPAVREALREGKLYIQISSDRNQDGEIRGQIPGM
jgi:hypothetical protein